MVCIDVQRGRQGGFHLLVHGGTGKITWSVFQILPSPPPMVGKNVICRQKCHIWNNLTLEQYNNIEEQCDKRNARSVFREVARRVDDDPHMGEHLKATSAIETPKTLSETRSALRGSTKCKA